MEHDPNGYSLDDFRKERERMLEDGGKDWPQPKPPPFEADDEDDGLWSQDDDKALADIKAVKDKTTLEALAEAREKKSG